jgi:DNA-directed RNA polymerase subunit alpha
LIQAVQNYQLPFDPWMCVDEIDFSIRSINRIKGDGIKYLGELVQKTEPEMLSKPNFGSRSLREVKEILSSMGARLGMSHPDLDKFNEYIAQNDHSPAKDREERLLNAS